MIFYYVFRCKRNWDKIVHKNVRSKDMDGVGNVVAINEDSISITTQGSQHIYKIPKSRIEGYNGAEVFLDLSAADMSTYDINSKSQALKEDTTTTAAKSAAEVSTSTPTTAQTQREAEEKARREAEAIEHTTAKESIEEEKRQQQIIGKRIL